MPDLPQELIDKIIDEVAQQGPLTRTLYTCSLVQKRWVKRCRSHLFRSLSLYRLDDFQDWIKTFPPGPNSLHHHILYLSYRQGSAILGPKQLLDLYPDHFTSFTRLETLQIFNLSLRQFNSTSMKRAFGPVGSSMRTLVARDVTLTLNSLLMFLLHFPHLQSLDLGDNLNMLPENKKRPPDLPSFAGELSLVSMGSAQGPFVLEFSKLPLRYSELDIEFRWNSEILNAMAHLILTCSRTLETLALKYSRTLFVEDVEEAFPLDLKSCALLRKVTIHIPNRDTEEHLVRLLGTIRSHKLETIEFTGPANRVQLSTWIMIDDTLCALVDGLREYGWKGELRAVIHYREMRQEKFEERQHLDDFRDRGGVVELVDDKFEMLLGSDWYI